MLGGHGYMRANPVERLYRDIRVDRIWEGTSEIQRVVVDISASAASACSLRSSSRPFIQREKAQS
ncbi:acyl-CoA dehydrogenase family protein [Mesorhizobium yinganensis]|uniref:acyl-CoA dehydrogenase family protein n=1 Tax=Mesorhizobium yinganensis TaxID=3157707 RepID=UPI0032B86E8B